MKPLPPQAAQAVVQRRGDQRVRERKGHIVGLTSGARHFVDQLRALRDL
jgi:hypothetical protein